MNRVKKINDLQSEMFINATEKMNEDDKRIVYEAIINNDFILVDGILKKYGFVYVTPAENRIPDDVAESLAASMLKHGSGIFDEINDIKSGVAKDYWSNAARFSDAPEGDYKKLIEDAREMEKSFYSKSEINNFINALHGENAVLIMKAAGIMDLIGCTKMRNDLLEFFSFMTENAEYSKVMEIYNKKKIISEDRSAAKKGKTNKHRDEVLRIAGKTWEKYPNASVAGISEEITAYLKKKSRGVPSTGTVQKWLNESGLTPDVPAKSRNRDFQLVI